MEIKLLEVRLYIRRWTGVLQLALIDGPDRAIAYQITTYRDGPKRTPGFQLWVDRIECGRLADKSAVKALESPPANRAA